MTMDKKYKISPDVSPSMRALLGEIYAYSEKTGLQPDTVAKAANKVAFPVFRRWVNGEASCTLETRDRIVRFLRDNPEWPRNRPRRRTA